MGPEGRGGGVERKRGGDGKSGGGGNNVRNKLMKTNCFVLSRDWYICRSAVTSDLSLGEETKPLVAVG